MAGKIKSTLDKVAWGAALFVSITTVLAGVQTLWAWATQQSALIEQLISRHVNMLWLGLAIVTAGTVFGFSLWGVASQRKTARSRGAQDERNQSVAHSCDPILEFALPKQLLAQLASMLERDANAARKLLDDQIGSLMVVAVSKGFLNLHELSREQLIGKTISQFRDLVADDLIAERRPRARLSKRMALEAGLNKCIFNVLTGRRREPCDIPFVRPGNPAGAQLHIVYEVQELADGSKRLRVTSTLEDDLPNQLREYLARANSTSGA